MRATTIRYGYFFVVALSLSFAAAAPVCAGVYATPAQRAADWLETQQDASDGSWRDSSEAKTFLQTAEAVLALHQANRRRGAYYAGQTWIENHDPQNLDARARRLLVLRATQSSAQPDIDALLAAISSPATGQSGWGLAQRYRAAPLDTALALDALRTAGAVFNSADTIAYLKNTQLIAVGDQGWPTAAGTTTDAYTTARVVQALSAYKGSDPSLTTPLANAVATLKTKVSTSSAPHVRAAALAYLRLDPASSDAITLLNSLTAIQRSTDGGFDAGVFATGLIVQSFAAAEGVDASTSRERVDITDAALRQAINEALGRGALDQLNRGELSQLTTLDISNRGVTSLNGLQYATNLTTLKGGAYGDIVMKHPQTGQELIINTVTTRADGITPITREAAAGVKIQNLRPDSQFLMIPKPKPGATAAGVAAGLGAGGAQASDGGILGSGFSWGDVGNFLVDFFTPGGVGEVGRGSDIVPRVPASGYSPAQSSYGGAAGGGFLLYPNKANTNMMQSVYSK